MWFPVPRYLLVSQSSIPALQAMWKLACEGAPATFGPLEAPISAKLPQNIFKWKVTLSNETSRSYVKPPLFEPSGFKYISNHGLVASNGCAVCWLAAHNSKLELQAPKRQKCELHSSSRNVRLTSHHMETWKPISVGAHTLQKFYLIYNEAVYRMKFWSDIENLPKIQF